MFVCSVDKFVSDASCIRSCVGVPRTSRGKKLFIHSTSRRVAASNQIFQINTQRARATEFYCCRVVQRSAASTTTTATSAIFAADNLEPTTTKRQCFVAIWTRQTSSSSILSPLDITTASSQYVWSQARRSYNTYDDDAESDESTGCGARIFLNGASR